MDSETSGWRRIEDLFHQAAELTPAERPTFLDKACGSDEELRREVESLLAADTPGDPCFQAAVDRAVAQLPADDGGDLIGKRVGRYTITSLIGQGGMGAVYRAVRQDDFRMEVAIKLLKRGTDTAAALARFRIERQILAGLQHPNIARLFDGGATESGLPYFVMEYVDGTPLLEYAGRPSVRQRLELFTSVCSAVQYAHDMKIVHRDIKPANILVTGEGIPKLLDFGIAKLLDPAAEDLTVTGVRPLTPDYASPEQLRGDSLTTATDIYSLGAVLYQLLTGESVRTHTSAAKRIDRDLTIIVRKAMREEPERRYAKVQELSDDVDRYLHDLPVHARKESLPYRGRKFVKRNRALIAAVAITAMIGIGAVAVLGRFNRPSVGSVAPRDSLWDHLKFEKIATLGDPAPGGGVFTHDFEPWGLLGPDDLLFVSDMDSGGGEGIFLLRKGAGLLALARPDWPAPGGGVLTAGLPSGAQMNNSGDVVFVFGLKPWKPPQLSGFNRAGVYRYSHADGRLNAVVIPEVTIAPGFGAFQSTPAGASLNNLGDIAFAGLVRTTAGLSPSNGLGEGVFLSDRNARISKVVAPGDPAPGGRFDLAATPWINDAGDIAFTGHLAGEECIRESRLGCPATVFLKRVGKPMIERIAAPGQQGMYGVTYRHLWGPALNNRGDLVFMGELSPRPGVRGFPIATGIFLYSADRIVGIALPGDVMPDGRKIATVNPTQATDCYSLNNRGDVVFSASLENGESGLYLYSRGSLHLIAGTGTVIPNIGTISGIPNISIESILNDSGQILFSTRLADGRGILLLATPLPAIGQ